MLDQDFLEHLEFTISKAFRFSHNSETRGYWCDGILLSQPENHFEILSINQKRQVSLQAFIGVDGQTKFDLILRFGNKALSRSARNLDLIACIPDPENLIWSIDTTENKLVIQLD